MGRPERAKPNEPYPQWTFEAISENPVHEKFRRLFFFWGVCQDEYSGAGSSMERGTDTGASTLGPIIHRKVWPSSETVARLEVSLDRPLWPRHIVQASDPRNTYVT